MTTQLTTQELVPLLFDQYSDSMTDAQHRRDIRKTLISIGRMHAPDAVKWLREHQSVPCGDPSFVVAMPDGVEVKWDYYDDSDFVVPWWAIPEKTYE